jgi:hypothetical protein
MDSQPFQRFSIEKPLKRLRTFWLTLVTSLKRGANETMIMAQLVS